MLWKCWPKLLILCVFLAVNIISFSQDAFSFKSDSIVCDSFPSPRDLDGTIVYGNYFLWWQKPILDSFTPGNLIAYTLYQNDEFSDSIPYLGQDTTFYRDSIDYWTPPGYVEYYVTALYDLSPCGYPNQVAESPPCSKIGISGYCQAFILAVFEDWSTGSFYPNLWMFDSNWVVLPDKGDPPPTAAYISSGNSNNYDHKLVSHWVDCQNHPGTEDPYIDGDIILEFDYKLSSFNNTGAEILQIETFHDQVISPVLEINNSNGSEDWTRLVFNMTEHAKGKIIRFGFAAKGENSADIQSWYLDNIELYRRCNPPRDLQWVVPGELMCWKPPLPHVGDSTKKGEPRVYKVYHDMLVQTFTTDTFYLIDQPAGNGPYFVTAVYEDCEPSSEPIFGPQLIPEIPVKTNISIFPNPCNDNLNVRSDLPVQSIQIFSARGEMIIQKDWNNNKIDLNTSSFPSGIYILKINTIQSNQTRKFIITH